ncbi:probable LRR receptor-like serine/threonine-protein kinase At3g47570 [Mercurialis annua]|uniref:probable LRR receptor-like serine/threonine-protein kinase At3g47570 n=1 Tax=Mercurialis annua TaxID=3986 RepID=UPI00215F1389|nr:probable LRR receptor-like serine/threonine-protein kinase At3g47570 [Mercurialis annua]
MKAFSGLSIVIISCIISSNYLLSYAWNETDRLSLLAFKDAITSDPNGLLKSWNFSLHFCQWQGISCGVKHPDRVTVLQLISQGLTGRLSAHIGNLSFLRIINLHNNSFHGEIPPEIGKLSRLRSLYLDSNSFGGEITTNLTNCKNLRMIDFSSNNFQGKIPVELSSLMNLEILRLGKNNLQGPISPFLGNISSLEELSLTELSLSGSVPAELSQLNKLHDLSFITNLTNCTRLERLHVDQNRLNGRLPDSLANLSARIRYLTLSRNMIMGPFRQSLLYPGRYRTYCEIFFKGSDITPQVIIKNTLFLQQLIPSTFGNLTALLNLDLEGNNLSGNIPWSFGNCRNLLSLYLGNNNLEGTVPESILGLSSIFDINLSRNFLSGSLPRDFVCSNHLGRLDLSKNKLSGGIPDTLSSCFSLEHFYIHGNSFSGNIPDTLSSVRGLIRIDLSRNNFSSVIPEFFLQGFREVPKIGIFTNATAISVIGNSKLCGGIPELKLPACTDFRPKKTKPESVFKVITAIVVVIVCSALFAVLFLPRRWRKSKSETKPEDTLPNNQFIKISYQDLLTATDGFSIENSIGHGSYGSVYKGTLQQTQPLICVAVKVFDLQHRGALKSFRSECEALRNVRHRNLVKILSVSSSVDYQGNEFRALIYEFMPKGSLESWLFATNENESKSLNFEQRLNIAIDVASAIEYLHCYCQPPIIHCDIKPSNVLIDEDFVAHVGDFGIAKILSEVSDSQSSSVFIKGTAGYVAPDSNILDRID